MAEFKTEGVLKKKEINPSSALPEYTKKQDVLFKKRKKGNRNKSQLNSDLQNITLKFVIWPKRRSLNDCRTKT